MLKKNRLFTPGPTPLLPSAQMAMASYGAHHRTAEFRTLFARVLADLKEFIGTQNDVLVLSSSGTGFMEASVSNLTSPGDKVLVLTAGKFGERWTSLAKAFGCNVEVLSAPYGGTFSIDEVKKRLTPDIRCVYVQGTESSTGARHDVAAIAKLVRALPDTLLVVDAITGLGTTHFDVDGWGIDVTHWRIAEGAHDPTRPGLWRDQRACLAADGDDEISALLLRSAEREKVGSQV